MRLTPPKQIVFLLSLILGILGLLGFFIEISFVSTHRFWFVVIAWGLLVLGGLFDNF